MRRSPLRLAPEPSVHSLMLSRADRVAIACSLIGGVVITVAISWLAMVLPRGNHWYGPPTTQSLGIVPSPTGHRIWQVSAGRNAWHRVVSFWFMQVSGRAMWIPQADLDAQRLDLASLPGHLRPRSVDDLNMQAWFHETGWPLPALACSVQWKRQILNSNIIYTVTGGVQLPRDAAFNPRALPLAPVWPGAAVNSLLYAAACFVPFRAARAVRRGRRRRRGLCARCGYPRRGLEPDAPCPECGQRGAQRASAPRSDH